MTSRDYYRRLSQLGPDGAIPEKFRQKYQKAVTEATTLEEIQALLPVPTDVNRTPFYHELIDDALETFLLGENNPEWPVIEYVLSLGVSEEELAFILERFFNEYDHEDVIQFIDDYVESGFRTMALMDGLWQASIDEPAPILHHLYDHYQCFDTYGRYRALEIYTNAYEDENQTIDEEDEEMIMGIVQMGFNDPGGFFGFAANYSTPEYDLTTPTFVHFEHYYRNRILKCINRDNVDELYVVLRDAEANLNALIVGVLRHPVQYREFIPRLFRFLDHHEEHTLPQLHRIFPQVRYMSEPQTGGWFIRGRSEDSLTPLLKIVANNRIGYNGLKLLVDRGARIDGNIMRVYTDHVNRYDAFLLIPNDYWGQDLKRSIIDRYPDIQRRVAEEMVPLVTPERMGDLNRHITQYLA